MSRLMSGFFYVAMVLMLAGCGGGSSSSGTSSTANSVPVANAGVDQNIVTASTVTLNGSASSDADGDTLTYSWSISSKPSSSDAILSDSTAVNPTFLADLDGSYVVQLIVNDGAVDSATATVTVTASTPNTAPIATSSVFQTNEDQPINDVLNGTDSDGDPFTFIKITNTINGLVTIDSNGTFSYVPNINYYGNDSFSYKVNDGQDDSAVQEVTITVNAVNDTPTVNDQNISLHSRQSYIGGISALDPENDNLIYTVNTAPAFGSFDIDANTGSFTYQSENNDGVTSVIVEITDGQYSVDTNLTFIVSTFDMENSIEICDSYKLYSNNFSVAAGLIQAYSDVSINISNMIDSNLTVTSAILYNGDNTVITTFYKNIIEPNYLLKLSGRYISDVTSLDNYWIVKYTDSLTGNKYISKYTYDSLENTSISSSVYINATGTIGCYDDTPYHGTYVTESDLGFDIAPIDDVLVSSSKIIPLGLNDAIISNDANITVSISPTTGMSATYSDGNLTLHVIEAEAQSNTYTVAVSATKGINQDIETFDVDYVVQHNASTTTEFRSALVSAAGNGHSDIIVLADGFYSTLDDGLGEFAFTDNEAYKLMLEGSSANNVILSGGNTNRVLRLYNTNESQSFILKRVTIQDGYTDNGDGGGVISNIDLQCENIIVKNNYAYVRGGGIYVDRISPTVLSITDSTIQNNISNTGAGISGYTINIYRSVIKDNLISSRGQGGGFYALYANIYNSIIAANSSHIDYNHGAGFALVRLSLVNSIIINNSSGIEIFDRDTNYIVNSVFSNNNTDVSTTGSASVQVFHTYTDGIWDIPHFYTNIITNGNLSFVDGLNGDYHLNADSILIDSGTDTVLGVTIPMTDFDGNPRVSGDSIDIGPYEYQP